MTSVSHLDVFLHSLVMCSYFSLASSLDNNKVVSSGFQTVNIDCGFADHTINITNITVESLDLSCLSSPCNLTEEQKSEIYNRCNDKHACSLTTIPEIPCLQEYGSFNVSYICEYVGNRQLHECSFEDKTTCGWTMSSSSKGRWKLGSGKTQNDISIPDHDHTTKSGIGQYLYTEFNGIVNTNKDFNVYITIRELITSLCISFWYQITKCRDGALKIKHIFGSSNVLLWSSSIAETESDWKYIQIVFNSSVINNYIHFVASRPKFTGCIVALDDILLLRGSCTASNNTQTITTIDQPSYTNNEPLSLSNEHETVYLSVCACIAAIGCIVTFFLIYIRRKGICGKPKNDNGKMGHDVQVIHDPYNPNKTGERKIQLDLLYSSPCDTLDESKHRESGPVYAMPSNAYCTANEVKRMDNSNGNPVGGTVFAKRMDIYAESVDGVYDTSGSRRHVEDDDNLYNHSVDSIYDHTQAENNVANDDATYDRTFANVTDSLYDVSRR